MFFPTFLRAGTLAVPLALAALPGAAADIAVENAYARSSGQMATTGAAFMTIQNAGAASDRVVAAAAPIAERVELHTHLEDANGVMRMLKAEEGFEVPAHGSRALARGGDHVMFLGLFEPFEQGDRFPLTLTFEKAGEITVDVEVDLLRMPMHGKPGQGATGPQN